MYSFYSLKLYYEHVVTLLHQASERVREAGRETEAGYKEKGREYDKEFWDKFHRVFEETYPGYFHNSFLISACSLFEHKVKKVWAFIGEEHNVPITWDDIKGPVPVRMQQLLNLVGVPLKDDSPRTELPPPDFKPVEVYNENRIVVSTLWEDLQFSYRLRNCIVHNNGLVNKARGSESITKYARDKGILIEKEGQPEIQLNEGFNIAVCDMMQKFFEKLMGTYYSTPIPPELDSSDDTS